MAERRFRIATEDEIRSGRVADVYFHNALQVLRYAGADPSVVAEVRARTLPQHAPRAVFCGLDEVAALLEGIDGLDVDALPEGSHFGPGEPVMVLSGRYTAFALHETALLGLLCQASGIASGAWRCRQAAGERLLLSFGARRLHPALAPMIERAAYVGGADGVSSALAAELIGLPARGTMPHALILAIGDTVRCAQLFDAAVAADVPRIVLVDTFHDEAHEAVRVARALGPRLAGVRLDTPSSRRGDFAAILRETRWELDTRGFGHVKLIASGGLDETDIAALREVADGFGVGSAISSAPHVEFGLDLVEVDGEARAKRGKRSGRKRLWRGPDGTRRVLPAAEAWPGAEDLLVPLLRAGRPVGPPPALEAVRARALAARF